MYLWFEVHYDSAALRHRNQYFPFRSNALFSPESGRGSTFEVTLAPSYYIFLENPCNRSCTQINCWCLTCSWLLLLSQCQNRWRIHSEAWRRIHRIIFFNNYCKTFLWLFINYVDTDANVTWAPLRWPADRRSNIWPTSLLQMWTWCCGSHWRRRRRGQSWFKCNEKVVIVDNTIWIYIKTAFNCWSC